MNATWGKYDNETYLQGIRAGDRTILRSIYDEFQPNIIKYIKSMGGTEEDGKDIFASALVIVYRNVKKRDFKLTSPFSAYLFSICKNILLKYHRSKKQIVEVTEEVERVYSDDNPLPDERLEKMMLHNVIQQLFRKLSKDCQKIIQMRWGGESYASIRKILKHNSEGYTRKRKHFCQQHLIKLIKNDGRVQELYY